MREPFDFTGRGVLIVGASTGLGNDMATFLHEAGARTYGSSRNAERAQEIAEWYGTAPVVLDAAEVAATQEVVTGLLTNDDTIDMVVINAGINIPQPALTIDEQAWDAVYNLNVRGLFFLAQACARVWVERGTAGAMVNITSQAGLVAIEDRATYGSSKAAVTQLTRSLAYEWARHGIRVNAVAPTFVHTSLTASTLSSPERAEELLSRIPLGRFGEPRDVSAAVAYLLSPAAAMVTGHTLVVDGGYTIH